MFRRQSVPTVLGLVLGLFGAALVVSYVRGVERSAHDGSTSVAVWVSTKEIAAGTPGSAVSSSVQKRSVPRRYAAAGALADPSAVKAQFTLERIVAGETLLERHFGTAASTRGRLAIPKGKEAVTVAIPIDAGLAQYAMPGDRVSVYATFKGASAQTVKIMSGVEVLATEARQRTAATAAGGTDLIVTLAATPEEASRLIFGRETGSIWLSLVPQGQTSPAVEPFSISTTKD